MEMEHINENTIRVLIRSEDLAARGFTFIDLLGNQQEIENFFYSILEEVDVNGDFKSSEAVTFQVLPNGDGLELFISKNISAEEIDAYNLFSEQFSEEGLLSFLEQDETEEEAEMLDQMIEAVDQKGSNKKAKKQALDQKAKSKAKKEEIRRAYVFELMNFEAGVYLAGAVTLDDVETNLVTMDNHYYLSVHFSPEASELEIKNKVAHLAEFARLSEGTADVLLEHGQVLMAQDAIGTIRQYFLTD
ncbi:adaptor protein MecA [Enterococcus sp. LJL98]